MTKFVTKNALGVRMILRAATAARHEALHRHPLFSRLMAPDVQHHELLAANQAHLRLFEAIEASRMRSGLLAAATLAPQIAALKHDVQGRESNDQIDLSLDCPAAVLGGLYVAHGAGFGAKLIRKNLATHLKGARASYCQLDAAGAWRVLCKSLERLDAQAVASASAAANDAFAVLGRTSPHVDGPKAQEAAQV